MRNMIRLSLVAALLSILAMASEAAQKPTSLPVRVEYTPPTPAAAGEQATTILTFRALADIERLGVSVAPFKGVEVVSEPTETVFDDVKKGSGSVFSVTVRVTDAKLASLAVTYWAQQGKTKRVGAITLEYGQ